MKIKRKVDDKEYIHKLLILKTNEQLKQICRDYKIRGFSKFGKTELVNLVHNSLAEEQLEEVFEIPITLIYKNVNNSSLDWGLKEIYEIVKFEYRYSSCVDIEKKDFKNISVKGGINQKRLDFTVSLVPKMNQPSITTYNDGTKIKRDFLSTFRKFDFISIPELSQEDITLQRIYQINFGDFPESSTLMTVKDWLILANLYFEDGDFFEALYFYEMVLREFKLSDDIRVDILRNLERTSKAIKQMKDEKEIK